MTDRNENENKNKKTKLEMFYNTKCWNHQWYIIISFMTRKITNTEDKKNIFLHIKNFILFDY